MLDQMMPLVAGRDEQLCVRCREVKSLAEFGVEKAREGRRNQRIRSWCKDCCRVYDRERSRRRTPTAERFLLNRARQRALGRLRDLHRDEYLDLVEAELVTVRAEAEVHRALRPDAAATETVPLLAPGRRALHQTTVERVVTRKPAKDKPLCSDCETGHQHGHRCRVCGSKATDPSFPEDQCPRCEPRFTPRLS